MAKSLLHMISNDIGQLACLYAKLHNLSRVYFGGFFIRGHPVTMHTITYSINFFTKVRLFSAVTIKNLTAALNYMVSTMLWCSTQVPRCFLKFFVFYFLTVISKFSPEYHLSQAEFDDVSPTTQIFRL